MDQIPDERKAMTAYAKQLQEQVFHRTLQVAVLHGKMKPREGEVMAAFAAGESDILVSTTVVEVGVDVPNATCMVVENAPVGLSQLHQLRGRVGRGKAKNYCILLSDSQNEETRARPAVMTQTNDGFRISQEDLRLRGPGDFFFWPAARSAGHEDRRPQLRHAAAGRGPDGGPAADGA